MIDSGAVHRLASAGVDDVSVLLLEGEIDYETVPAWRLLIQDRLAERPSALVLDLERVEFVDSSGLGMLIATRASCAAQSTALRLRNVPAPVRRLFATTGMQGLFDEVRDAS